MIFQDSSISTGLPSWLARDFQIIQKSTCQRNLVVPQRQETLVDRLLEAPLVEKWCLEQLGWSSSKDRIEIMNKTPQVVERLVLGCMDSYDCESRRIFSILIFKDIYTIWNFCNAQISKFQLKIVNLLAWLKWNETSRKFQWILQFFC